MKFCPTCDRRFEDAQAVCPDDGTQLLIVHTNDGRELLGRVLDGRYRIESHLAVGGMGMVFMGVQTSVGRKVAIKVLSREVAKDVEAVKRFMQEARTASALSHPNIITIHDFGQTPGDGLLYLVMEYVKGETLAEMLARVGPISLHRAVGLARQILDALEAAHAAGIIHRDLKPANIIMSPKPGHPDFLKVLDFGLAKTIGAGAAQQLTQTGQVFGTPGYMAPEQGKGERCDHRADFYAVGVMLFELLAGQPPFEGSTALSILVRHINDPPPNFKELDPPVLVPDALAEVIFKAMAKTPEERFDSAASFREMLLMGIDGVPDTRLATRRPTVAPEALLPTQAPQPIQSSSGKWVLLIGLLAFVGVVIAGLSGAFTAPEPVATKPVIRAVVQPDAAPLDAAPPDAAPLDAKVADPVDLAVDAQKVSPKPPKTRRKRRPRTSRSKPAAKPVKKPRFDDLK